MNTESILLSYEDLRRIGISFSKEHLRRLEAQGRFPSRRRPTERRVAWRLDEVQAWIDALPTKHGE